MFSLRSPQPMSSLAWWLRNGDPWFSGAFKIMAEKLCSISSWWAFRPRLAQFSHGFPAFLLLITFFSTCSLYKFSLYFLVTLSAIALVKKGFKKIHISHPDLSFSLCPSLSSIPHFHSLPLSPRSTPSTSYQRREVSQEHQRNTI